jgi:hypothetical protein
VEKKKKGTVNTEGDKAVLKVQKKKKHDLQGFEDVIDGFLVDQELKEIETSNISFEKGHDNYSLYDFLDLERKRLNEVEKFLSIKIPNMKNYNQTKELLKSQDEKRFFMRDDIVKRIKAENSSFISQMRQIFNQAFN